jgi:hypothetical protein
MTTRAEFEKLMKAYVDEGVKWSHRTGDAPKLYAAHNALLAAWDALEAERNEEKQAFTILQDLHKESTQENTALREKLLGWRDAFPHLSKIAHAVRAIEGGTLADEWTALTAERDALREDKKAILAQLEQTELDAIRKTSALWARVAELDAKHPLPITADLVRQDALDVMAEEKQP